MSTPKTLLGRVERVSFPTLGIRNVPAKIDTGADASSIWCGKIKENEKEIICTFFAPGREYYTGTKVKFQKSEVDLTRVANSFGHRELRYKIKIPMEVKGRKINATFTLTDRSTKLYPILIGRSTLQGKFVVDVSKGDGLHEEEDAKKRRLKREMRRLKKALNL